MEVKEFFRRLFVGGALFLALAASPARAALIDDANTVIDTTRNLRWLDLTETKGISYNSLQPLLSTTYAGWRYATTSEVQGVFAELGLPLVSQYFNPAQFTAAISQMASLFGDTLVGYSFPGYYSGTLGLVDSPEGASYRWRLGAYTASYGGVSFVETVPGWATEAVGTSAAYLGHWLVEDLAPVPLPGALLLLASGLGLLGVGARRCGANLAS